MLVLVLKRGFRVREIRKLLQRRIGKELDRICTQAILERVEEQVSHAASRAAALALLSCEQEWPQSAHTDPVLHLVFLGQYFRPPYRYHHFRTLVQDGQPTGEQEESDWRPDTYPYQLFSEHEGGKAFVESPPHFPGPSINPTQLFRLDEDLLLEVLKASSAQTLCELIADRSNVWFCRLCAKALGCIMREEVLKIVRRALALDRLHRVGEVDNTLYWRAASSARKLRDFPIPTQRHASRCVHRLPRRWAEPSSGLWDIATPSEID